MNGAGNSAGINTAGSSRDHANTDCKDSIVWDMFQSSFSEVQAVLDRNRILISEINRNHEAHTSESLARNVSLIKELNSNIARVVNLYADLSTEFVQSMNDVQEKSADQTREEAIDHAVMMDIRGDFTKSTSHGSPKKKSRHT